MTHLKDAPRNSPLSNPTSAPVEMAADVEELNERYLRLVQQRALCHTDEVQQWQGRTVHVFLRHETDHVFAVAGDEQIGMANALALSNVTFRVDEAGREETCRQRGALPNGRNVHAFVSGTLLWADMQNRQTPQNDWQQVVYNPHSMTSFQLKHCGTAIQTAARAMFTHDPVRVWQLPADDDPEEHPS